jgi:hypothetical protein
VQGQVCIYDGVWAIYGETRHHEPRTRAPFRTRESASFLDSKDTRRGAATHAARSVSLHMKDIAWM